MKKEHVKISEADRTYLERAILEPEVEIVEGYPPAMPPYAGRIPDEDLRGILDYLMGLNSEEKTNGPPETSDESATAEVQKEVTEEHSTEPTAADEPVDPVKRGETLADQNGCLGCHSTDGSRKVGPSYKGLWGSERTVIKDGQEVKVLADTDYLIRALREPGAEIAEGYPAIMPPFPGLSDDDIKALQAWLESLR